MDSKHSDSDNETELNQKQFKILLLGDGSVGKTSIAVRFTQDHFNKIYKQTIGLDFFLKRITLPGNVEVALQLWDIGGQSIGSKMLSNYIHGSAAILLCYDITNYESFQDLEDWLRLIKQTYKSEELPLICVIGNKVDLTHISAVSKEKHDRFVEENEFGSYYVSAKTGDNIERAFFEIAAGLSKVDLTDDDINAVKSVVPAPIVIHQSEEEEKVSEKKTKDSGGCVIF